MKTKKRPANRTGTRGSPTAPPTNAWPKGVSGNPDGRPKSDPELVEAFREMTPKALDTLNRVMDQYAATVLTPKGDPLVPAQAAVKAAEVTLNRGWGTAPSTVKLEAAVTADVTGEVKHTVKPPTAKSLAKVAQVLNRAGVLQALNAAAEAEKTETAEPVETQEEPT